MGALWKGVGVSLSNHVFIGVGFWAFYLVVRALGGEWIFARRVIVFVYAVTCAIGPLTAHWSKWSEGRVVRNLGPAKVIPTVLFASVLLWWGLKFCESGQFAAAGAIFVLQQIPMTWLFSTYFMKTDAPDIPEVSAVPDWYQNLFFPKSLESVNRRMAQGAIIFVVFPILARVFSILIILPVFAVLVVLKPMLGAYFGTAENVMAWASILAGLVGSFGICKRVWPSGAQPAAQSTQGIK